MRSKENFLIGTYTQQLGQMSANGEGIYTCSIDLQTGALTEPICVARCVNPSYLAWGHGGSYLYATREVFSEHNPAIVSFVKTGDGHFELTGTVSLQGELPCHVGVDAADRFLSTAQYGSGDVVFFKLGSNGEIIEPGQMIQHSGRGPNVDRQNGPHAHYAAVLSEQDVLLAVDLGIDSVLGYEIDPVNNHVADTPAFSLQTTGGAGPRHVAILPGTDTAYVYCELTSDIYQVSLAKTGWQCIETVQAFDQSVGGAGAAIKIAPDQRHLYVSGRDSSEITCFDIDQQSKRLSAVTSTETGGKCPRDFSLTPDGSYVVVANQLSDNVVSFHRDANSGLLEPTGFSATTGSPVCVLFQP